MNLIERYRPLYAPDDAVAAPAPAANAAPAADAVVVAPVADAPAATTESPAPNSDAAPAADAAPAETKSSPSLLESAEGKPKDAKADKPVEDAPAPADAAKTEEGKEAKTEGDKKPDAKADDAKKDDAAKGDDPATEATAEPQPPAPVKYEAFKVPDGIKLDDKKLEQFTGIIGALQVPQEKAQEILDLYVAEKKADHEAAQTEQRRVWDTLNDTWKSDLRKDEKLGGNRLETTLSRAKAVIEEYGGNPQEVAELIAHTSNNGMGNFPGFIRLLDNLASALNVYEDSIVPGGQNAPKPQKGPGNRGWYDNSMGKGNGAAAS